MRNIHSFVPRVTVTAMIVALLVAMSLPGIAAAAPVPIRFDVYLGDQCVGGVGSADAVVNVVWRNASGAVKARATAVNFYGRWSYCAPDSSTITEIGDSIKASDGSSSRTLVLPRLTVNVNRVDDVVRGKGPAGAMLRLSCGGGPFPSFEPCRWDANVRVSVRGSWSLRPGWDLLGGSAFAIRWLSAAGDKVRASGAGPFVTVTLGSSRFSGLIRPNRTAHLVIRDGNSFDVRATGSAADGGAFSGRFRNDHGQQVSIRPGDILSSDISPDIDWIVPAIDATASASTDVVSGRCFDAGTAADVVQIRLTRAGLERGWAFEGTQSDGTFSVYLPGIVFPDPAVIKSGDRILVSCMQTNADWVQKSFIVP